MGNIYLSDLLSSNESNIRFPNFMFTKIVREVTATLTGLDFEEEKLDIDSYSSFNSHISAIAVLAGGTNLMFSISVPEKSAQALVSFMTGIQPSDLKEEDLQDGITEILNIILGQVKAMFAHEGNHYNTLPIFSVTGNKHHIDHKGKVVTLVKKFKASEIEILISVYFL